MTIELSAHLSEEAMNDVLIGLGSPESNAHLAACPACRNQMQEFQSDMRLFNQTSLAWSETRSATMPLPAPAQKSRIGIFAPVGLALAAALLVAIGLLAWNHNPRSTQNFAAAPTPSQQDYEGQIAADNELMRSVDMALNAGEESPISEYRIVERPHPRLKTRPDHGPAVKPELRNR
jgi:hypothetical protein